MRLLAFSDLHRDKFAAQQIVEASESADLQSNGEHQGSNAIRDAALRVQPKLLLCGHIHDAWGTSGHIGSTPVYNLGPTLNWFTV